MAEQVNQQENIASNVESDAEKLAQAVKPETPAVDVPEEDPRPPRPFLYRFRGLILAIVAIVALVITPADLDIVPFLVFINIFIIAVYMRVKARRAIGDHTRGSTQDAPVLVTWGAYGRLRHPLYVSNMAIGIALVVLHLGISWITIPFIVFLLLFGFRLAKLDDRYLEQRYGDQWKLWASQTPAFVPREIHVTGPLRSGKEAIIADTSTWIWLALMVGLVLFRKIDFIIWA
ncbi:methyltransferase family protein [Fibrobacter sp.]|uniref:methyltransferase family protein n=1 Tax=Fibrobacter sp. TaxID=35828 RepID=UPI003868ACE1